MILATIGGPLIALLGFLGSLHPAFDLIAHFRYHAALGCIALALLWLVIKQWRVGLSVMLIGVYAFSAATSGLQAWDSVHTKTAPSYSLLSFNVLYDNPNRADVVKLIEVHDPDIFIGVEMSTQWHREIRLLTKRYKNTFHCPEWKNKGGLYIFSKFAFTNAETYCHSYAALGTQQVMIEDQTITIGGVHLRWPWPGSQPKQLKALKPVLQNLDDNALVAGDFNAATWSYTISSFATNGGLRVVPNIGLTWLHRMLPSFLTRWIGLPIDNVMHKGKVSIVDAKSLPNSGSDHLPILVQFTIKN